MAKNDSYEVLPDVIFVIILFLRSQRQLPYLYVLEQPQHSLVTDKKLRDVAYTRHSMTCVALAYSWTKANARIEPRVPVRYRLRKLKVSEVRKVEMW